LLENGSARGQASTISDHAVAGDEPAAARDLAFAGPTKELHDAFYRSDHTAAGACLTGRQLATAGIDWVRSLDGDVGVAHEVMGCALRPYRESPKRHEYILTQKGLDLYPVMMALVHWGDTHMVDECGRPLLHEHRTCGKLFDPIMACSACGGALSAQEVHTHPGPGGRPKHRDEAALRAERRTKFRDRGRK
jgi:hypothetical protein